MSVVDNTAKLKVHRISENAVLPTRAHGSDAGLDLVASEELELDASGGRGIVGTGLIVEIPQGFVGLVCPRSGIATRHGVTLMNAPGVIDSGYRGELRVALLNTDSNESYRVKVGERVAQLLIMPIQLNVPIEVETLSVGDRDSRGFGSTGGFGNEVG